MIFKFLFTLMQASHLSSSFRAAPKNYERVLADGLGAGCLGGCHDNKVI